MDASLSGLIGFAGWLLRVSLQTSVVIGLVLVAQWMFQNKLSPRWRYALWMLVLIRLMLPVSLESAFSIFNYAKGVNVFAPETVASQTLSPEPLRLATSPAVAPNSTSTTSSSMATPTAPPSVPLASTASTSTTDKRDSASSKQDEQPTTMNVQVGRVSPSAPQMVPGGDSARSERRALPSHFGSPRSTLRPLYTWFSLLWLGGVLFFLTRIIWFPLRLNAQLAQHETATGPAVFEVLEQSKRLMGMRKVVPIVQSRAVASPALLGFIRPWLLLPDGMVERFTPQELRFVFLHELAHLKRRDIAVNWLMTILQILHWFNPLIWFAFNRMRADRELACDELALSFAKADENKSYG